jgi:hypothetical protein
MNVVANRQKTLVWLSGDCEPFSIFRHLTKLRPSAHRPHSIVRGPRLRAGTDPSREAAVRHGAHRPITHEAHDGTRRSQKAT